MNIRTIASLLYALAVVALLGASAAAQETLVTTDSIGAEDGFIIESGENTTTGGYRASNWTGTNGLLTGDQGTGGAADGGLPPNAQILSVVSFDTSNLPDDATVVSATLRVRRGQASVGNASAFGNIKADIKSGYFGTSWTLEEQDFEAPADAYGVAQIPFPPANGFYSWNLTSGLSYINKTGRTQLRLYFETEDDNDGVADYLGFNAGDTATVANRPKLQIVYVSGSATWTDNLGGGKLVLPQINVGLTGPHTSQNSFTVTNTGTANLNMTSASITGTSFTLLQPVIPPQATLAASGGTTDVIVQFDATGAAPTTYTATLTFETNDSGSPHVITVECVVIDEPPTPTWTDNLAGGKLVLPQINLKSIGPHTSQNSFTVTNTGGANLNMTSASIAGTSFTLVQPEIPPQATLAAGGGTTDVIVRFDATGAAPATYTATLTFETNDSGSPHVITVECVVIDQPIPPTWTDNLGGGNLVLPLIDLASTGPHTSQNFFTLTNTGSASLEMTTASIAGTSFTLLQPVIPSTLAASGGTTDVIVQFDATGAAPATYMAPLTFETNDPDSPHVITVECRVINSDLPASKVEMWMRY